MSDNPTVEQVIAATEQELSAIEQACADLSKALATGKPPKRSGDQLPVMMRLKALADQETDAFRRLQLAKADVGAVAAFEQAYGHWSSVADSLELTFTWRQRAQAALTRLQQIETSLRDNLDFSEDQAINRRNDITNVQAQTAADEALARLKEELTAMFDAARRGANVSKL